jgi:N-methylhydantoinase A/oxoprolinase/acetone carboxylase beta subunit
MTIKGPAIILNKTSTIVIEPHCSAEIDDYGSVIITVGEGSHRQDYNSYK